MGIRIPTTLSANGPPTTDPVSLFVGEVMHARLKPVGHRFSYRVANILVDLDRLDAASRQSRLFSIDRFNLFSFHQRDHGPRDGSSLRGHVDRLLAEAGVERPDRVLLLCYPRVLGFVFNPISVYFAFDGSGHASALIYEVRNTFGESHTYVAPVEAGSVTDAGIRQTRDKRFYVSPFMPMEQRYHFRVMPPGDGVRIRILESDGAGPTLAASFVGRYRPVTSAQLTAIFAIMPMHTLKVVAGILFEAGRLYLKGAPYFPHRRPPPPVSGEAPPITAGE